MQHAFTSTGNIPKVRNEIIKKKKPLTEIQYSQFNTSDFKHAA